MPAHTQQQHAFSIVSVIALILTLGGAASMVYYHLGLFMPRVLKVAAAKNLAGPYSFGDDFYPIWLTSRECVRRGCDPYGVEMTREIQEGLFGRSLDAQIPSDPRNDYRTFAYPAFTDLLFWPASIPPFKTVRVVLSLVLALLTAASLWLWMHALGLNPSPFWLIVSVLLVLGSYQVLEGLYADQLGLLVGFLAAAGMEALRRGRIAVAGIFMALTSMKPQMTVLAICYLLLWSVQEWKSRRRFGVSFVVTIATLAAAAEVFWPHWVLSWIGVVRGYHRYAKPPLVSEVLAAPFGPELMHPIAAVLTALLLAAALWIAWRSRGAAKESNTFWLTLSLLLCVTTVTLLPGQALHDHVELLPAIFLIASAWHDLASNRRRKLFLAIGLAITLWPWVAAFALICLRPVLTYDQFYSKAIFALPLRTAAAFPFVVLGLLLLTFRISVRPKNRFLPVFREP